jgi:hypothetical protein
LKKRSGRSEGGTGEPCAVCSFLFVLAYIGLLLSGEKPVAERGSGKFKKIKTGIKESTPT